MRHVLLFALAISLFAFSGYAQKITVIGGPGKVPGFTNRVYKGLPFTAQVSGLNGTVQRWSAGIGTVQGQNIFFTSNVSQGNIIIDRAIDGATTGLLSVGATNGNGVSAYLVLQDPPATCNAQLLISPDDCFRGRLFVGVGGATDATSFNWSISQGSGGGTTTSPFRSFINVTSGFNTITVTISGGICDGETLTYSGFFSCEDDDILRHRAENADPTSFSMDAPIRLYPNPTDNGQLKVSMPVAADSYQVRIVSPAGVTYKEVKVADQNFQLDVSDLPQGVYYLQARGSNGFYKTQRLIVE